MDATRALARTRASLPVVFWASLVAFPVAWATRDGYVWLLDVTWVGRWETTTHLTGWGDGVRDAPLWHLTAAVVAGLGPWGLLVLVFGSSFLLTAGSASLIREATSALPQRRDWHIALAVAVVVGNPWTLDRADAGQFALLAGVGIGSWVFSRALNRARVGVLVLGIAAAGGLSPHAGVMAGAGILVLTAFQRRWLSAALLVVVSGGVHAYLWWAPGLSGRDGGDMGPDGTWSEIIFGLDVFGLATRDELDPWRMWAGLAFWALVGGAVVAGGVARLAGSVAVGSMVVAGVFHASELAPGGFLGGWLRDEGKLLAVGVISGAVAVASLLAAAQSSSPPTLARRARLAIAVLAVAAASPLAGWVAHVRYTPVPDGARAIFDAYGDSTGVLALPFSQYVDTGPSGTVRHPLENLLTNGRISGDPGIADAAEADPGARSIQGWLLARPAEADVLRRHGIEHIVAVGDGVAQFSWLDDVAGIEPALGGRDGSLSWRSWRMETSSAGHIGNCGTLCVAIDAPDGVPVPTRGIDGWQASDSVTWWIADDGVLWAKGVGTLTWGRENRNRAAWLITVLSLMAGAAMAVPKRVPCISK